MKQIITVTCFVLALVVAKVSSAEQGSQTDLVVAKTSNTSTPILLYVPDGQLKSHSLRVYVTTPLELSQMPRLQLLRSHAVAKKAVDEAVSYEPGVVAPGQEWTESVNDLDVRRSGTLLLFDISNLDSGVRGMVRVTPVLSWADGDARHVVVGETEINIGSLVAAIAWTCLVVGAVLLLIILLARIKGDSPLGFLTGVDGHLSLAQTQVACWTTVVGAVVLGYGFVQSRIPEIPSSLLAMMGASLATGGIAYFQDSKQQALAATRGEATKHAPAWSDLVRVFTPAQQPELSLAKAQMLFWTVLLLVIFVSKSLLDGKIWDVPWPLVALLGFSQAGYLAPKLVK